MTQSNHISRRNLIRNSLGGFKTLYNECESKEPSYSPADDEVSPETVANEVVTPETIMKKIDSDYVYRLILQRLLAFCSEPKSSNEIHEELMYFPDMRQKGAHTPETLLTWMIDAGAVAEHMEEGAETKRWLTTEAGMEAIAAHDPSERLRRLLEEEPGYVDIYRMILEFCSEERSLDEIERILIAHPGLKSPQVYPSYLVERLEFAGALEWTGGVWHITETGKESLEIIPKSSWVYPFAV